MGATPRTVTCLAELLEENDVGQRLWVEHVACGSSLGIHMAQRDKGGTILLGRFPHRSSPAAHRGGPMTTPGVNLLPGRGYSFVRVTCSCLPAGHEQKMRMSKLGALAVTFPEWKWNREIDLPVVAI